MSHTTIAALTNSIIEHESNQAAAQIVIPSGAVLSGDRDYEIIKHIGAGGMGAVYTATPLDKQAIADGLIDPVVAIKIFASDARVPDHLERREIGMLKALRHDHIVPLYDSGEHFDHRFLVIRYCSNGSVQDRLLDAEKYNPKEALGILISMLEALVETHSCGILHLDIKPANILIDEAGRYLLSDFGAARNLFQQNQRYLLGTPFFMSPEQARAEMERLDARSDLFSLAASLWLVLYPEDKVDFKYSELQKKRKTETLPPLANVMPEEHHPLAKLLDRMLEFDPRKRPGSVAEVLLLALQIAGKGREQTHLTQAAPGLDVEEAMRADLKNHMSDPIILELLTGHADFYQLRLYEHGDLICVEDSLTFEVFILLHGKIEVIRSGRMLFEEKDEGTILGEVSALAGHPRTATLRAHGDVILAAMNAAELEQAARRMPALAVRIMKNLARRVIERDQLAD